MSTKHLQTGIAGSESKLSGLLFRRVRHHRAKLTMEQVKRIRSEHIPYVVSYGKLAKKYGCGESTIRDICKHRTRCIR